MTNERFWLSFDQEEYTPFQTIENAINDAKNVKGTYWLGKGYQKEIQLSDYFDIKDWIEQLENGWLEEEIHPEYGLDLSEDQYNTLQTTIKQAINDWQNKLPEKLTSWNITWTKNPEKHTND